MLRRKEVLLCLLLLAAFSSCRHHRARRYLIFPDGSDIELAIGFDLPIEVNGGEVGLGIELEVEYDVPSNATELTENYISYARRASHLPTRWQLYAVLEMILDRLGIDGRACLLRAVCEVASSHMVRSVGLSAEILHVLLTPSSTVEPDESERQVQREYSSAEKVGAELQADCTMLYPECSLSLLELVSRG